VRYILGLDLGQARDPSALAIIEQADAEDRRDSGRLDLRDLRRWDLGTTYPAVVDDLRTLMRRPELAGHCSLVVDGTGVGRPVVDYLRGSGIACTPATITGAQQALAPDYERVTSDGWWSVPKRDLVSALAVALETDRLRIAAELAYAPALRAELGNFKAKITLAGNDTYEAWRESDHDDLVLATALAVWWTRIQGTGGMHTPTPSGGRSLLDVRF
jgi:hypothetical protein